MDATRAPKTVLVALLTAVAVAGCSQQTRRPRQVTRYDAKTFYETTSVFGASFSADESRILITSDATGVFNVYSQPVKGGQPTPLTHSTTESVFGVSYFPHDDRILFTADKGGNERNHLFVREAGGAERDLTPGDEVKASFAGWSGDKKHFWVTTNERDPQHFDVYRYATDGYERERVFENTEGWTVADVSRDGRYIALGKIHNNADSDIYIHDVLNPSTEPKHITAHEGNVNHQPMTFTPDSKAFYYLTDGQGEFYQGWSYDLASAQHKPVIKADWDVQYIYFSENGKYRVSGVNNDARTEVTVLDTAAGRRLAMPQIPAGDVRGVSISRSEKNMAFYVNGSTAPSNLYAMDLQTRQPRRLTDTLNPSINPADLVEGTVVRYPSFDGVKIPSVLYRPKPASARNKVPALVWVHGGPGGQSRLGYSAIIQHLVNNGYAILAVNNRGSSGYGKTFFHMDDRKHGEADLKDCVWGRKYLETLDWVDGQKVGIIGGSYGGFMVAAALTFEPQAFDVGVNIFGVTNWLRTLKSIPPWWASFRDALYAEMGDPAIDEDRLRRISPLFHAANIVKPLLVVQGANDPRVLQAESDELVAAARKNGTPVEYVLFPDEGHGFRKKANRIKASEAFVKFLDQYLRGNEKG
ncbi:MAG: alpha/beta fold hydrolase [Phycisphaerae bacterium]